MSEIEKLYENAGIEPRYQDCCKLADKYWDNENIADEYLCFDHYMKAVCPHNQECTDECKNAYDKTIYPEFTAEKQLEMIKWLAKRFDFGLEYYQNKTWAVQTQLGWDGYEVMYEHKNFAEALAGLINHLWQDLTDTEKAKIKRILE